MSTQQAFSKNFEKELNADQKVKAKQILKILNGENTGSAERILFTLIRETKEFSTIDFSTS